MAKIPIRNINPATKEQITTGHFTIRDVRGLLGGKDMIHPLHRHNFYFILALQKGKGVHEIDFSKYRVCDHSVFMLRPGQVHQLELKAGCTGYLLEFDPGFYPEKSRLTNPYFRQASAKNFCRPGPAIFKHLYALLANLCREYTARQEGYRESMKAYLDIFFIELARQSRHPQRDTRDTNRYAQERLEELSELLENHITKAKQASYYANLMNLSPYQLNAITKNTLGKTISALINDHIVLEAKRHLLATSAQVKDIAWHLGYEDVSYFIRFFRKHTGYSPDGFRRHFR